MFRQNTVFYFNSLYITFYIICVLYYNNTVFEFLLLFATEKTIQGKKSGFEVF